MSISTSVMSDIMNLEETKIWVNNRDAYRVKKAHDDLKSTTPREGKVKGIKNSDGTYTVLIEGQPYKAKKCNGRLCKGKVRLLKHFHKDSSRKDGYRNICSRCRSEQQSYYNMYNPKRHNEEWT